MNNFIPVLLYHHIGEEQGATSEADFAKHLSWLVDNGYHCLSLPEFQQRLSQVSLSGGTRREVMITFDDGYADIYTSAFPVLKHFNIKATAFLITDRIGRGGYLDWPAVIKLQESCVIDCQSHSHTHSHWQSLVDLREDLLKSRRLLAKHLNKPAEDFDTLAWPWGVCNEQWEDLAGDAGFTTQFLVQTAAVLPGKGRLKLPRITCDAMPLWRFIAVMKTLRLSLGNVPLLNRASYSYRQLRGGFGYQ